MKQKNCSFSTNPIWEKAAKERAKALFPYGDYKFAKERLIAPDGLEISDGGEWKMKTYSDSGEFHIQTYKNDLECDMGDGNAAILILFPDGAVSGEFHMHNGKQKDGYSYKRFHKNGLPRISTHFRDGKIDSPRDGIPSRLQFYENGTLEEEKHHVMDKGTNPTCGRPWRIYYDQDGTPTRSYSGYQALDKDETILAIQRSNKKRVKLLCGDTVLMAKSGIDITVNNPSVGAKGWKSL